MHLSVSMVPSTPGEWDAGFDSIFREQRKRRATDSKRERRRIRLTETGISAKGGC